MEHALAVIFIFMRHYIIAFGRLNFFYFMFKKSHQPRSIKLNFNFFFIIHLNYSFIYDMSCGLVSYFTKVIGNFLNDNQRVNGETLS